jgi:AmiR/NasT family two-component response regulator
MRLRTSVLGALNLFSSYARALDRKEVAVAQALADIATIGILQHREIQDTRAVASQLEGALQSRIVIEQAKGVLAERSQISVDAAFARFRQYARAENRRLSDVARDIVDGALPADTFTGS